MPIQIDNEIAHRTSDNSIFTSSDFKERPSITMSITQSHSFESNPLSSKCMDETNLAISYSGSSESLNFDENGIETNLKDTIECFDDEAKNIDMMDGPAKCEASVVSSSGIVDLSSDRNVASSRTNDPNQGNPSNHRPPKGYGPPLPHGYHLQPYGGMQGHNPHYHPHYQQYYSNVPHFHGEKPQQIDHRYGPHGPYHPGMQYPPPHHHQIYPPHGNYPPPPQGYRHGPPPPMSDPRQQVPNSSSSVMSSSSHGSRKRNLKGMMDEDSQNNSFVKHRSSSNSSACSIGTSGNNTTSETFNKMICESPMKRERVLSPDQNRRESSGSGASALTFGELYVGGEEEGEGKKVNTLVIDTELLHRCISNIYILIFVSLDSFEEESKPKKPKSSKYTATPVTKNTNNMKQFSFDEENDVEATRFSPEGHSLNKQLRDQSFTPIHPADLKTGSQAFSDQLEIAPQLSWSISDDAPALGDLSDWPGSTERNTSPMSAFDGDVSPMLFKLSPSDSTDGKSASVKKEDDIMRIGVLSPTDANGSSDRSPGFSFPNMPMIMTRSPYPKPPYHDQTSFPALSPKGSMPMGSPLAYPFPPTPQSANLGPPRGNYDSRDDMYHRNAPSGNRDGPPPTPNYQSPRPIYHGRGGQENSQDRIRNLRGRVPGAIPPQMNLPPHFPSHHAAHFLTSPIGATPRGVMLSSPMGTVPRGVMLASPHHHMGGVPSPHHPSHAYPPSPHLSISKRKCFPMKTPIPSKFQGDMEACKNAPVPEFTNLVNFPAHMSQKQAANIPDGTRCCVMCGHACQCSVSNKNRKGGQKGGLSGNASVASGGGLDSSSADAIGAAIGSNPNAYAVIPSQNKGLCTQCDVNVWIVAQNKLEIKWCKGCKNFRPWAAFGEKGLATKCMRCRERQREKYAKQKEEKDKNKALSKAAKAAAAKN